VMPAPSVPALVTCWRSYLDISGTSVDTTWADFFAYMRKPRPYQGDREHPGWSPCRCEPPLRKDENVQALSALVLDCDGGGSIEGAREIWAPFYGFIHTTRKHSEASHRYRIVLPLSRHVTPAEHAKLWSWANARAVRAGHRLDAATRNVSRFWYEPGTTDGPFESHDLDGQPIDVDAVLAELARQDGPPSVAPAPRETSILVRIRRASHYIGKMDPAISGSGGHAQTWKVALVLTRGFDLSDDVALDLLEREYNPRCQPPWSRRQLEHKIKTARRDGRVPSGYLLEEDATEWHTRTVAPPEPEAANDDDVERDSIRDEVPQPKPSPFAWIDTRGIFAPLPPTDWRVPGLQFCAGRPSMLAGYGASGKTLASQAMLLASASARKVWGEFRVLDPLRCRHIDHEQGKHATLKRYQRLAIGLGITQEELGERLEVSVFPNVYLNTKGSEDIYARECEGIDIVVLDALRGATPGVDENDSKIRDCIDQLARVSEKTGTAFWILHHAGKPKDGHTDKRTVARGSSAIFDACGAVFVMVGEKGEPKLVSQQKSPAEAEGDAIDDFYLKVEDVPGETSGVRVVHQTKEQIDPPTNPNAEFEGRVRDVFEFISRTPGVGGAGHVAEALRLRRSTAFEAVRVLLERGHVVDRGTAKPKQPRLYATAQEAAL
jgi:hypothetical protein